MNGMNFYSYSSCPMIYEVISGKPRVTWVDMYNNITVLLPQPLFNIQ